jgi:uncharacterized protein
VLVFFGLFLLTTLAYGALATASAAATPAARARHHLQLMVGVELFDVILVGAALLAIGRPPRFRRVGDVPPIWVWTTAVLGVFLLLALNHLYHSALGGYVGGPATHDPVVSALGVTPLVLFAYCVQPAIVEELFFRYAALDTLRGVMNVHGAVIVSAVMFGLAHIGVPLSIPILALIGVAFGYARVASGRLALPILLHFLHNLLIVLGEAKG